MADLTLADINNYLKGLNGITKITSGTACATTSINGAGTIYSITDADTFLLSQAGDASMYNTSSTTKDNFLELYKEQYARNTEAFIGIIIVGAILAKMMFYPTK